MSCQQWGDVYVSLTNAALWLKMGEFCLKKEGKKEREGLGGGPEGRSKAEALGRDSLSAVAVITSQREKWKTWEAGLGRHGG